jgi:hypothetical protein
LRRLGRPAGAGLEGHTDSFVIMARTLTRPLLLVLLALCLVGCEVGLDVGVDVERDGSGTLSVSLRADREAQDAATSAGGDPLAVFAAAVQALEAQGWRARDERLADGTRAVALSRGFADPAELERLSSELAEALAAPEGRLLEPLRVVMGEDTVRVEGAAAVQPGPAVADLGLTPESVTAMLRERGAFDYTLGVRLPDPERVLAANATRTDPDGRLVWQVAPGEAVAISAEGVRPQFPWLLVGAAAAGALLLAAVAVLLLRRRAARGRARGRLLAPSDW